MTISEDRRPERPSRRARREARRGASHYTIGGLLIAVGVLMLADQLTIDPFGLRITMGRLWPVILLALGATAFATARAQGRSGGGYWLFFLGGLFLLHTYDILRLTQSWPMFVVAGGLSLMFSRDRGDGRSC